MLQKELAAASVKIKSLLDVPYSAESQQLVFHQVHHKDSGLLPNLEKLSALNSQLVSYQDSEDSASIHDKSGISMAANLRHCGVGIYESYRRMMTVVKKEDYFISHFFVPDLKEIRQMEKWKDAWVRDFSYFPQFLRVLAIDIEHFYTLMHELKTARFLGESDAVKDKRNRVAIQNNIVVCITGNNFEDAQTWITYGFLHGWLSRAETLGLREFLKDIQQNIIAAALQRLNHEPLAAFFTAEQIGLLKQKLPEMKNRTVISATTTVLGTKEVPYPWEKLKRKTLLHTEFDYQNWKPTIDDFVASAQKIEELEEFGEGYELALKNMYEGFQFKTGSVSVNLVEMHHVPFAIEVIMTSEFEEKEEVDIEELREVVEEGVQEGMSVYRIEVYGQIIQADNTSGETEVLRGSGGFQTGVRFIKGLTKDEHKGSTLFYYGIVEGKGKVTFSYSEGIRHSKINSRIHSRIHSRIYSTTKESQQIRLKKGTWVVLNAIPDEGYEFERWEDLSRKSFNKKQITFQLTKDNDERYAVFKKTKANTALTEKDVSALLNTGDADKNLPPFET